MILTFRTLFTLVGADVKILDYTNSQIVTMDAGTARLQTGTFKLIHVIETDRYQELIDNMQETVSKNISESHFLRPFLVHELIEMQSYLDRLKPRAKRSLNFIGSAWKWIAGNPDHDDFEIIKKKTDEILADNNKQVVINKLTVEKVNEIIGKTNEILRTLNYDETMKEKLITHLKLKIDILKEEIVNIQYAIHWAKVGIVNSFILSPSEINIVKQILNNELISFVNLEQVFEFAEIKIASDKNSIIYIISIPTTDNTSCNKILVKPIKFEKFINKIKFQDAIICNKTIYGIRTKCKTYNQITICNKKQLENINTDTCLANLIKSRSSNCSVIDNRHVPTVEEIIPGTILLNQFNGTVYINSESQYLKGTYVLQFQNASIQIMNKSYNFYETTHLQPLPAILQPRQADPNIESILSLEMVKELQVNNTEAIDQLSSAHKWGISINLGLSSLIISSIILMYLIRIIRTKRKEVIIPQPVINTNPSVHLSIPQVSELHQVRMTKPNGINRISQIPYF